MFYKLSSVSLVVAAGIRKMFKPVLILHHIRRCLHPTRELHGTTTSVTNLESSLAIESPVPFPTHGCIGWTILLDITKNGTPCPNLFLISLRLVPVFVFNSIKKFMIFSSEIRWCRRIIRSNGARFYLSNNVG